MHVFVMKWRAVACKYRRHMLLSLQNLIFLWLPGCWILSVMYFKQNTMVWELDVFLSSYGMVGGGRGVNSPNFSSFESSLHCMPVMVLQDLYRILYKWGKNVENTCTDFLCPALYCTDFRETHKYLSALHEQELDQRYRKYSQNYSCAIRSSMPFIASMFMNLVLG